MKLIKYTIVFGIFAFLAIGVLSLYEAHQTNVIVKSWMENRL